MEPQPTVHQRLGVIADDLTGAADTALSFWEQGIATSIQLDPMAPVMVADGMFVVAVDTDSRHRAPKEASRRVAQAIHCLRAAGISVYYKKIDSTLRGNIGAEVEAALDAAQASLAIVCPAFPAVGRTVVQGRVLVDGVDLLASGVAADPRNPVPSSRVAEILARQTDLPIVEFAALDLLPLSPFPIREGGSQPSAAAAVSPPEYGEGARG